MRETSQPEPSSNRYGFPYRIKDFHGLGDHGASEGISEEKHASQNRRQTAVVSLTELMIFMGLETMALRTKISTKNMPARTVVKQIYFSLENL